MQRRPSDAMFGFAIKTRLKNNPATSRFEHAFHPCYAVNVMGWQRKIFISATTQDLKSCRQIISHALRTQGYTPVVEEDFAFGAGVIGPILEKKIRQCEAIVHVAGTCFGEEPEHKPGKPRRSYAQTEYHIAHSLRKKVHVFLCEKGFPYDAHSLEPSDLQELQEKHRESIRTSKNVYFPVTTKEEVAQRIRELPRADYLNPGKVVAITVVVVLSMLALAFAGVTYVRWRDEKTLEMRREAIAEVSDWYSRDTGLDWATDQERFDDAIATVAKYRKISAAELRIWMDDFAGLKVNPRSDSYDRALAEFADKHFASAAREATKSAEQRRRQREAADKGVAVALERDARDREAEYRSWLLAGNNHHAAGSWSEAVDAYRNALALIDQQKDPRRWCDAAFKLEMSLYRQGKYVDAESLGRQLRNMRTNLQGSDDPETLVCSNALANVLEAQGNFREAEPLCRSCLEGFKRKLPPDDPYTLNSMGSLAQVLYHEGNYEEAEPLFRGSLEGFERKLGPDHPATLNAADALAGLCSDKGQYTEAERLYRRCLTTRERTSPQNHPDIFKSANNLALLLDTKDFHLGIKDDYAEAESLLRRCLDAQEEKLRKDDLDALSAVGNLGILLLHKQDYSGAEPLLYRCLEGLKRALGSDHPATLCTLSNLGQLYTAKGDYAAAESKFVLAEEGMNKGLPLDHPWRLDLNHAFSMLREEQGRIDEAIALEKRAVDGAHKKLRADQPDRRMYEQHLVALQRKVAHTTDPATGP